MIFRHRTVTRFAGTLTPLQIQRRFNECRCFARLLSQDTRKYSISNNRSQTGIHHVRQRTEAQARHAWGTLPVMDFATTYEALLLDAERIDGEINRKELWSELNVRLEKQANIVTRVQQMMNSDQYPDPKVEDAIIAQVAHEEHVNAKMKNVKLSSPTDLAEDYRPDVLPATKPNLQREKLRWNTGDVPLHPLDTAEIHRRLVAWLPEKYHFVYIEDFQTVAANDTQSCKEMLEICDAVEREYADEAKQNSWETDLKEVMAELRADVDFTRHITPDAIKLEESLDTLELWAQQVHDYNGDNRMFQIYERANELTGSEDHKEILARIRQWDAKRTAGIRA